MKRTAIALAEPPRPDRNDAARRNWLAEWVVNILVLIFASASVAWPYVVPTSSMEGTIVIGDHLLVDRLTYSPAGSVSTHLLPYSSVKRGDIVVFRYPVDIRQNYVKRVIGVPGDRIRIVNKQVYLNGKRVEEPYKVHKTDYVDSYRDNFPAAPNSLIYPGAHEMLANHVVNGEVVVPLGRYFAMGDNRDNSLDSRYWGFVPRENIIGKPVLIWWSYDAATDRLQEGNINLHHLWDIATNFFGKTRWERTFDLVRGYPLQ